MFRLQLAPFWYARGWFFRQVIQHTPLLFYRSFITTPIANPNDIRAIKKLSATIASIDNIIQLPSPDLTNSSNKSRAFNWSRVNESESMSLNRITPRVSASTNSHTKQEQFISHTKDSLIVRKTGPSLGHATAHAASKNRYIICLDRTRFALICRAHPKKVHR